MAAVPQKIPSLFSLLSLLSTQQLLRKDLSEIMSGDSSPDLTGSTGTPYGILPAHPLRTVSLAPPCSGIGMNQEFLWWEECSEERRGKSEESLRRRGRLKRFPLLRGQLSG